MTTTSFSITDLFPYGLPISQEEWEEEFTTNSRRAKRAGNDKESTALYLARADYAQKQIV